MKINVSIHFYLAPFLLTLLLVENAVGVEIDDFFPFGEEYGDEFLPPMTDGSSGLIPLRIPFPFFDRVETLLSVDVHGTFMFEGTQAHHTPDCSPVESISRMVAVFWADIVTHEGVGGSVSFRQDTNPNLLRKATREIVEKFPKMAGLRLKWLFIATWLNVTFYGAEGCLSNPNHYPRNTFQAALATDGTVSFAIFYYNKIIWTTSRFRTSAGNCSGLGGFPARVGFDPGDMKNFYSFNESCTNDVVHIDDRTNSDEPGKWIFRIDHGNTIQMTPLTSDCSKNSSSSTVFDGKLRVMPSFVDAFGGKITLHGPPCLDPRRHHAVCIFHDPKKGKLDAKAWISSVKNKVPQVHCIVPFIHDTGRIKVELEIIDKTDDAKKEFYYGLLTIIKKLPEVKVNLLRNSDGIEIEWDHEAPSVANATSVDIEILEFYDGGPKNSTWRDGGLLASNVLNTGRYEQHSVKNNDFYSHFLPDDTLGILTIVRSRSQSPPRKKLVRKRRDDSSGDIFDEYNEPFEPIDPNDIPDNERHETTFNGFYRESQISDYILKVGTKTKEEKRRACLRWYEKDDGVPLNSLLPCPPTLNRARFDTAFDQDPCAYFLNKKACLAQYHPGAYDSYLSAVPNEEGHGQQCTYSKSGELLVGPPGGGTADISSPWNFFGQTEHMERDMVPWVACCSDGDMELCRLYYEKRPSDDGTRYKIPALSSALGDPHITTFDGLEYTFNGIGEFWMVKPNTSNILSTFKMQARLERFNPPISSNSTLSRFPFVNGSVFTAFVMRDGDGMSIQVQLAQTENGRLADVWVDGDLLSFDNELLLSQQFEGFSIRARSANLSELTISFASGVTFRFLSSQDAMSVISSANVRNRNAFGGLLGNFDGEPNNDLTSPNGTKLDPTSSSLSQIHFDFGLKWMVQENESMFRYIDGESFASFSEPDFVPLLELPAKLSEELPEEVIEVCGSSQHCVFDYLATGGSLAIASYTAEVETIEFEVKSVVETAPPVMCPSIDHPQHGYMFESNGSSFFDGVTVQFECDTKNGFNLTGPASITCQNGTWSDQPPRCLLQDQIEEEAKRFCLQPPSPIQDGFITPLSPSTVKFSCNRGFVLVGAVVISCENGVWDEKPPVCLTDQSNMAFLPIFIVMSTVVFTTLLIASVVLFFTCRKRSSSTPLSTCQNRIPVPTVETEIPSSENTADQKLRQPLL